jgi:hypothetical protein
MFDLLQLPNEQNRTAATRTSRFELKSNPKSRQSHRGKKEKGMDFLLTCGSSLGASAAGEGRGKWRTRSSKKRWHTWTTIHT